MIITASLIGGWDKLELWDHTHALLFSLLFMVCALEVVLWKMTNSLFSRSNHFMEHDADYTGSDEYEEEEDIYYEDLSSNYDQMARRQMRYRQRQQHQQEQQVMQHSSDSSLGSAEPQFYNGHPSTAGVLRYFQ